MTSDEGTVEHFRRVFERGPVIVYNVPKRAPDIAPKIMERLADHENMIGVKECAGPERIKHYTALGIRCWSGDDADSFQSRHECGATGVVSVAANLIPTHLVRSMSAVDGEACRQMEPLLNWMSCAPNPIPIASAMAMTGAIEPVFRLPYVPLSREDRKAGLREINQFEADLVVGKRRDVLNDSDFTLI